MNDDSIDSSPWRCLFCRMRTGVRLFEIPVCEICRDQVHDFLWASAMLGMMIPIGVITGLQFLVEELLLFVALILVKHRFPRIFDRFERRA